MSDLIDPQDQSAVNAILLDRSERIEMALFGNGNPESGLIGIVAAHGEAVEVLQAEFEERTPTKREKYGVAMGAIIGFFTGAGALLKTMLG